MANGTRGVPRRPLEERFWPKVDKNGPVPDYRPDLGPCWVWTGAKLKGYGQINSGGHNGRALYAHRVAWEWTHGPITEAGVENPHLDHLCRVTACVNPDHLELVTCKENVRRGNAGQRCRERGAAVTHCKNGHEFTEANTYRYTSKNGVTGRHCRQCAKDRYERHKRAMASARTV